MNTVAVQKASFCHEQVKPKIGSRILNSKEEVLSGVLVFPELEEQEIYNISLDAKLNPKSEYLKGASYWYIDGAMNKAPIA